MLRYAVRKAWLTMQAPAVCKDAHPTVIGSFTTSAADCMQVIWPSIEGGFAVRLLFDLEAFLNDIEEEDLIE